MLATLADMKLMQNLCEVDLHINWCDQMFIENLKSEI